MKVSRSMQLTIGAAISAAVILVAFFNAPPLPVAAGTTFATLFLLFRRKAA
jgi:hypothetical protein